MKKLIIENLNEIIYTVKLDSGFQIFLYPTKKSKNFYITLTTNFGAKVTSYKKNNKNIEVIPGTAHFLEHKVMNLNNALGKELETLGTMPNAYTSYMGTTYNLYGHKNIKRNIEILFERVFNFSLTDKSVENEKSIINQEIDMVKDNPNTLLFESSNKNTFYNEYLINRILGEKETISKINKEYLYEIYDDFYTLNNMFCVVTGNFDKDSVLETITEIVSKIKTKESKIKINKIKEPENIKVDYEEINMNLTNDKVCITYKIPKKLFNYSKRELNSYFSFLLKSLFSSTSEFNYSLKEKGIILNNLQYSRSIVGDYIIIKILSKEVKNIQELINQVDEKLKNINITEEEFNRKKKVEYSINVLGFEDIEVINDDIVYEILDFNKIITDKFSYINNLDYKNLKEIIKNLNLNERSIVVIQK